MNTIKASVIILAWNGIAYLKPCLDAVLAQAYPDFEVIVVDNASTDGSADFVAEHYPQIRLIRNSQNLGFSAGNNIGLRAARGEVLLLLNQDTEVHPGWLTALVLAVQDPTVGIAGCKLLYPNGTIQHAGAKIVDARGSAKHIGRGEIDVQQYEGLRDVDFVTGAALALTRSTFTCIGPLDEGFMPAYYEDVDWCYRARVAGLRVVYCSHAIATHYESTSSKTTGYLHLSTFHQGRLRFLFKHQKLDTLSNAFVPAESEGVCNLPPGDELTALRQAWVGLLLSLPEIIPFRLCYVEPDANPQAMVTSLLEIVLTLRELCVKELPFADSPSDLIAPSWISQVPALHQLSDLTPQPFHSDVFIAGPAIVAFREIWLNMAARWYIQPLITQQQTFNRSVTQLFDHITHSIMFGQQENAQHVRELNILLSELLRLQMRVTELESQLFRREDAP